MQKISLFSFICLLINFSSVYSSNDPKTSEQWWIKSDLDSGGANIEKAWTLTDLRYRPKIAIIDTGFDITHKEIKGSIAINYKEVPNNGIDDDGNGYIDDFYGYNPFKKNGNVLGFKQEHGTFIMGIISAKHNNGVGIRGVTNGFDLIPIVKHPKIGKDKKRLSKLVKAFEYALARGADIINFSHRLNITSRAFEKVLKKAYDRNVIVVVSAGNGKTENVQGRYPGDYAKKFSNIIVVAASDAKRVITYFSNYGAENVHIFAPGSKILSTMPKNKYDFKSGTSFAAPIVSGVAALVLSAHGKTSAYDMRHRLVETSHRYQNFSGKVYANGLIDAYNAIEGQYSFNFIWRKKTLSPLPIR